MHNSMPWSLETYANVCLCKDKRLRKFSLFFIKYRAGDMLMLPGQPRLTLTAWVIL